MVCSKGRAKTAILLVCLDLGLAACADGVAYPYEDGYYYDEGLPFDGDDFDRRDDFRFHHHLHHHHGHLDYGDLSRAVFTIWAARRAFMEFLRLPVHRSAKG